MVRSYQFDRSQPFAVAINLMASRRSEKFAGIRLRLPLSWTTITPDGRVIRHVGSADGGWRGRGGVNAHRSPLQPRGGRGEVTGSAPQSRPIWRRAGECPSLRGDDGNRRCAQYYWMCGQATRSLLYAHTQPRPSKSEFKQFS